MTVRTDALREYQRRYQREYKARNVELLLARRRELHALNRDKINAQNRKWRSDNLQWARDRDKEWSKKRSPESLAKKRIREKSYKRKPGYKRKSYKRKPYSQLTDIQKRKRIESWKRWFKSLKVRDYEKYRCRKTADWHRWRAKVKSSADGTVTPASISRLFNSITNCPYCNLRLTLKNRHLDHMEPLANGGRHTITNITPCCDRCNVRKGAIPYEAWISSLQTSQPDGVNR